MFREGFVDFYTEKESLKHWLVEKNQQINEHKNVFVLPSRKYCYESHNTLMGDRLSFHDCKNVSEPVNEEHGLKLTEP